MGIVIHNVVFVWMLTIHSVLFLSSCSSGSGENAPGEGNLNWAIRIGGQDFERPGSILVRTDGTILVLGGFVDEVTFGRGEKNETILDPTDGYSDFIAEYNSNGKLTWAKLIGPASIHTALTNGHSCSVGSFSESVTFDRGGPKETTLTAFGVHDGFLACYENDYNLDWVRQIRGTGDVAGSFISVSADGSILLSGRFTETVVIGHGEVNETIFSSFGDRDIFFARYKSNGSLAWAVQAGGANKVGPAGIRSLVDGSFIATGIYEGAATFGRGEANETTITADGYPDSFIARYNSDGTVSWVRHADVEIHEVSTLVDGSFFATGYFFDSVTLGMGEANETTLQAAGSEWDSDAFLAQYNPDGTLLWAIRFGGEYIPHGPISMEPGDSGDALFAYQDGSFIVGGRFHDSITLGPGEANETTLEAIDPFIPPDYPEIYIARYHSDGKLAWARAAGGPAFDFLSTITALPDGSCFLLGSFNDMLTFGHNEPKVTTLEYEGEWDIFLAKLGP